jgi:hypothetical protein
MEDKPRRDSFIDVLERVSDGVYVQIVERDPTKSNGKPAKSGGFRRSRSSALPPASSPDAPSKRPRRRHKSAKRTITPDPDQG